MSRQERNARRDESLRAIEHLETKDLNILLTGATGYIGGRLRERLQKDPRIKLRLLVRNARKLRSAARADVVEADTLRPETLGPALAGIEVAYYLVHSMAAKERFEDLDRRSAENFRDACISAGVRRVVYLGGLGERRTASRHLASRIETGEILSGRPGRVQTIWFRAGIIIGPGSASFEILRNLIEKVPLMILPRWVRTRTQPISVADVLDYLERAKDLKVKGDLVVDIGSEVMSFKDMLRRTSRVMGLRRLLVPVPLLSPRLSSYLLVLFTPVPFAIASALVDGLKSETVVGNDAAAVHFPDIAPRPFEDAIRLALREDERDRVISRWCDASAGETCDIGSGAPDISSALFIDRRVRALKGRDPKDVWRALSRLGGRNGWFTFDILWEIRGLVDKLLGGAGTNRGRRAAGEVGVGDKVDFWKVEDVRPGRRLLLEAQMKVPGRAWLEFKIESDRLVQTAAFEPRGLWGRLYWYLLLPFHALVFPDLARQVVRRAGKR